jgi:hypothetical protein
MSQDVSIPIPKHKNDWLTVVAIAAISISLNVAFHEGVHALACIAVGGHLQAYSALYSSCDSATVLQEKIVAGSAPIANLIAGTLLWIILRYTQKQTPDTWFFLWLFMFTNWCYGAGYFMFSGISNQGDWAVVFAGLEPGWLWRIPLSILGILLYIVFVRLSLMEFGKMIGGDADEQIRRGNRLFLIAYITSFVVVMMAGFFCPYGLLSLPVVAGTIATLGALSPLLWMMRWYRTKHFVKIVREPLEIHRKWQWPVAAVIVVFIYVFILGRSLYF